MPGRHKAPRAVTWIWKCSLCAIGAKYASGELKAITEEAAKEAAKKVHIKAYTKATLHEYKERQHRILVLVKD